MDDARIPVDSLASSLAYETMREQFAVVVSGVGHLRRTHDVEILHDVRVANRRLRAAIVVFETVLPKRAASLRERLGEFGKVLGEMRDLDVLLERVASGIASQDSTSAVAVLQVLERRRAALREPVLHTLESAKTQRLLTGTEQFLTTGPLASAKSTPVSQIAKIALHQAHDRVHTLGEAVVPLAQNAPEAALHTLRVRTKRLRYTAEMFEPVFGAVAKDFAHRAEQMQDVLGEYRDASGAARQLRDLAAGLPPLAAFETGRVAQTCLESARKALKELPAAYKRLDGGRWRKLVNAADDAAAITSKPRRKQELEKPIKEAPQ
ncbi:MAG: CHAD domain-containing protein [Actinomycetota bacterium]